MPRNTTLRTLFIPLALTLLAAAGCGGGGGGGGGGGVPLVDNPGTELAGIWTGTFSDQFTDYTVALEIQADALIPVGDPAWADIAWGEESLGTRIEWGEFVEVSPGVYAFEYDTYDFDGNYLETVAGEFALLDPDYGEGTFDSTSGAFGEFSLALAPVFTQDMVAGSFSMVFSDAVSRDLFYRGEVTFDAAGNVLFGAGSYLTDDLEGPIDPGANVWEIEGGYLSLVDPDTGYFEGELFFASPDDTIFLAGYYGWDFGVFAGIFEDILGDGLVTFLPIVF
ncbi:MAG: hypothetical protein GF328_07870 [Candidatus Latescibacteria bacterium]|nr:hypothetical protein [Candidatus Latescibacterota bacterium]